MKLSFLVRSRNISNQFHPKSKEKSEIRSEAEEGLRSNFITLNPNKIEVYWSRFARMRREESGFQNTGDLDQRIFFYLFFLFLQGRYISLGFQTRRVEEIGRKKQADRNRYHREPVPMN